MLYELSQGNRRRLLLSSANLSRAAWGAPQPGGELAIDNFELGVILPIRNGFSHLLVGDPYQRATCTVDYAQPAEPQIAWLAGEWDGEELHIECRLAAGVTLLPVVHVTVGRGTTQRVALSWSRDSPVQASIEWPLNQGVPVLARLETDQGVARTTAVRDARREGHGQILCGEFEEDELRDTLDLMLEEKYGYRPFSPDDASRASSSSGRNAMEIRGTDYSVPAYLDARRRFGLIDNWWHELSVADDRTRTFILNDGKRIHQRWKSAAATEGDPGLRIAARIAADEFERRIRHP